MDILLVVTGQKVDILDKATLVEKFQIYWI